MADAQTGAGVYVSKQTELDQLLDSVFDDLNENEKKEGMGGEGWLEDTGDEQPEIDPQVAGLQTATDDGLQPATDDKPTPPSLADASRTGSSRSQNSTTFQLSPSTSPRRTEDDQKEESSRHRRKKKKRKKKRHDVPVALYDPNLDRIKELCDEIDDDENGELDFDEFFEVLTLLDQKITRGKAQDIYNEITWTNDFELRISDFIDVITRRVTSRTRSQSPAELIFQAFPHIFDDGGPSDIDSAEGMVISIISSTFHDQDDDQNGFIDIGEFSSALKDLGLTLGDINEVIFLHFIQLQQSSLQRPDAEDLELLQEEVEIESFIEAIRPTAIANPNLQIHQVLQAVFSPIVESSRRRRKKSRATKKKREKQQPQSIIYKKDFELAARALRQILIDCDDDGDAAVDFEEFEEAMVALKTTLPRAGLRAVFNYCSTESELGVEDFVNVLCDCHVENPAATLHDLIMEIARRGRFTNFTRQSVIMLADFGKRNSMKSMVDLASGETRRRNSSQVFDVSTLAPDLQVTGERALRALRTLLDDLDDNADGNVDFDEFRSLLREVGLGSRFSPYEQETCFKRLSFSNTTNKDIDEIEASLMGINQVLAMIVMDHPDIGCHKLVYKLMKRILRGARRRTQSKMREV